MNTNGPAERVVVIDDDHAMRLSCKQILVRMGFEVEVFDNGADGLDGVARLKPVLVVVDLKMPGIGGMEVVTRVHDLDPDTIIIVITGYATIGTAVEAMKSGAYDFLPKPFAPDEMRVIVSRGLERRALLRETRQLREDQEQLRRRFITFVSHQLQSPLSAVHQYLDVLKRLGPNSDEVQRAEWLERCLVRTAELQALIRDWLTLARVEGGTFVRTDEPVDVRDVVRGIPERYQEQATAGNITIEVQTPEEPCPVHADRTALEILVDNFVTNAIKYNRPNGTVSVSARQRTNEILLEIADTGIGIPKAQQEFLFHEFFRINSDATANTTGTGLGLAICKRIASELGASIDVSSEEGKGTTFCVALPLVTQAIEADALAAV